MSLPPPKKYAPVCRNDFLNCRESCPRLYQGGRVSTRTQVKQDTVLLRIYRQFDQDEAIAYIKQQMDEQKAAYEKQLAALNTKIGEDKSYIAELEDKVKSLNAMLSEKKGRKLWSLDEVVKDLHERIAAQQRANTELRRKLRKETDFAMSVVFKYNKLAAEPIQYNPQNE